MLNNYVLLLAATVLLLSGAGRGAPPPDSKINRSIVKVSILDPADADIPGLTLSMVKADQSPKREVKCQPLDSIYRCDVEPGWYVVELAPDPFLRALRRAPIQVVAGVDHTLTIHPPMRGAIGLTPLGDVWEPDFPLDYESLRSGSQERNDTALMQSHSKVDYPNSRVWRGPSLVFTYATLEVRADEARQQKGHAQIAFSGTPGVYLNGERIEADHAVVNFKERTISMTTHGLLRQLSF